MFFVILPKYWYFGRREGIQQSYEIMFYPFLVLSCLLCLDLPYGRTSQSHKCTFSLRCDTLVHISILSVQRTSLRYRLNNSLLVIIQWWFKVYLRFYGILLKLRKPWTINEPFPYGDFFGINIIIPKNFWEQKTSHLELEESVIITWTCSHESKHRHYYESTCSNIILKLKMHEYLNYHKSRNSSITLSIHTISIHWQLLLVQIGLLL